MPARCETHLPRSGREIILATKIYANDDTVKSWLLLTTTVCLIISVTVGTLLIPIFILQLACSFLLGLLLVRLFVIYHDHQHGAILPRSRLARILMEISGIISVSPSSIWKHSHNHHHHHNCAPHDDHIGSFPVLSVDEFQALSRGRQRKYLITRHPIVVLLGYLTEFIWGMCLKPFFTNPTKHWDGMIAVIVHLTAAVTLVWIGGISQLILTQTIPYLIAGSLGTYLFYSQHNFPTVNFASPDDWKYEIAALNSSSFMKMNPVMHWFTANISYHHIHHLNAKIPFYRLPEAMAGIPETQQPHTTSLALRDIRACFRIKLWDKAKQQMIPWPMR